MKNTLLLALVALFSITAMAQKREPMTAGQLRDSLVSINTSYDERRGEIAGMLEVATDSALIAALDMQYQALEANCSAQMFNYCMGQMAKSPVAMEYLYMLRLNVSKDAVRGAVSAIKGKARNEPYAIALKRYVESEQVKPDAKFIDFLATAADSSQVRLADILKEKNVILIFGDSTTVDLPFLKRLYDQQGNSQTEIINFTTAENVNELTLMAKQVPWMVVSDFEGHVSKVRCDYNAEILPTTVYITKAGVVELWAIGVPDILITLFVQQ